MKEEIKDQLKKISAEIGMIELKRASGEHIPYSVLAKKRREFKKLSVAYRKEAN